MQPSMQGQKARKPAPRVDYLARMEEYLRGVRTGETYVSQWTKLAVERHYQDLERAEGEGFGYYFDAEAAGRALRFIHLLKHVKGDIAQKPLEAHGWALFFIASIFGWKCKGTQGRRYRTAVAWLPRGNSKSTVLSAASLYATFAEGGQADSFSLATTKEQAGICWGDAASMLRSSPNVMEKLGVEIYQTAIVQPGTNSSFKRVASRDTTLDGLNVSWAVIDELHEIPRGLWDVITTALGKRQNSILVSISTAGMDEGSFGREQYTYCRQVLSGEVQDDSLLALIYECPAEADPYSEEAQRAANPMFGLSVRPEILKVAAEKAKRFSGNRAAYLVKHLNVWQSTRLAYFDLMKWDENADPTLKPEDFASDPCYLGLDLASRFAFACTAKLFVRVLPHRNPEKAAEGEREPHYYLFVDSYVNEEAVQRHSTDAMKVWANDGNIIVTPGNITDYNYIRKQIEEDVEKYDVREIDADAYETGQLIQLLPTVVQEKFVLIPQRTPFLSPALKQMAALIVDGRLHHNGNPAMRWMVGNTTAKEDANENVYPRKEREENLIDGVTATLNALGRALTAELDVYTADRGFLTL